MASNISTSTTGYKAGRISSVNSTGLQITVTGTATAASDVGRVIYMTSGAQAGEYRRITARAGNVYTIDLPFSKHMFRALTKADGTDFSGADPDPNDTYSLSINELEFSQACGGDITRSNNTLLYENVTSGRIVVQNNICVLFEGIILSANWLNIELYPNAAFIFGYPEPNGSYPDGLPTVNDPCTIYIRDNGFWGANVELPGWGDMHFNSTTVSSHIESRTNAPVFWRLNKDASSKTRLYQTNVYGYFGSRISGSESFMYDMQFIGGDTTSSTNHQKFHPIDIGLIQNIHFANTDQCLYVFFPQGRILNANAITVENVGNIVLLNADFNYRSASTADRIVYFDEVDLDNFDEGLGETGTLAQSLGRQGRPGHVQKIVIRNTLKLNIIDSTTQEAITDAAKLTILSSSEDFTEITTSTGTFDKTRFLKEEINLKNSTISNYEVFDYELGDGINNTNGNTGIGNTHFDLRIQVFGLVPISRTNTLSSPQGIEEVMSVDIELTELDTAIIAAYTELNTTNKLYDFSSRKSYLQPQLDFDDRYCTKSGNTITTPYSVTLAADGADKIQLVSGVIIPVVGNLFTGDLTITPPELGTFTSDVRTVILQFAGSTYLVMENDQGSNIINPGVAVSGTGLPNGTTVISYTIATRNLVLDIPNNALSSVLVGAILTFESAEHLITTPGTHMNMSAIRAKGTMSAIFITNPYTTLDRIADLDSRSLHYAVTDYDGELRITVSAGIERHIIFSGLQAGNNRAITIIGTGSLVVYGLTRGTLTAANFTTLTGNITFEPAPVLPPKTWTIRNVPSSVGIRIFNRTGDRHDPSNGPTYPNLLLDTSIDTIVRDSDNNIVLRSQLSAGDTETHEGFEIIGLGTSIDKCICIATCPDHSDYGFIENLTEDDTFTDFSIVRVSSSVTLTPAPDSIPAVVLSIHTIDDNVGVGRATISGYSIAVDLAGRQEGISATLKQTNEMFARCKVNPLWRQIVYNSLARADAEDKVTLPNRGSFSWQVIKLNNGTDVGIERGYLQLDGGDSTEDISGLYIVDAGNLLLRDSTDNPAYRSNEHKSISKVSEIDTRGDAYGTCTSRLINAVRNPTVRSSSREVSNASISDNSATTIDTISDSLDAKTIEIIASVDGISVDSSGIGLSLGDNQLLGFNSFITSSWSLSTNTVVINPGASTLALAYQAEAMNGFFHLQLDNADDFKRLVLKDDSLVLRVSSTVDASWEITTTFEYGAVSFTSLGSVTETVSLSSTAKLIIIKLDAIATTNRPTRMRITFSAQQATAAGVISIHSLHVTNLEPASNSVSIDSAELAEAIENAIINEMDGRAVLASFANVIANSDVATEGLAAAVWAYNSRTTTDTITVEQVEQAVRKNRSFISNT